MRPLKSLEAGDSRLQRGNDWEVQDRDIGSIDRPLRTFERGAAEFIQEEWVEESSDVLPTSCDELYKAAATQELQRQRFTGKGPHENQPLQLMLLTTAYEGGVSTFRAQ